MPTVGLAVLVAWARATTGSDTGLGCPDAPAETLLPDGTCDGGAVTELCEGPCPDLVAFVAEAGTGLMSFETCDGGWTVVTTLAGPESSLQAWFAPDGGVVAFFYYCYLCAGDVCCAGELTDRYETQWGTIPEVTGCEELPTTTTTTPPPTTAPPGTPPNSTDPPPAERDDDPPVRPRKRGCGCSGVDSAPIGTLALLVIVRSSRRPRRTLGPGETVRTKQAAHPGNQFHEHAEGGHRPGETGTLGEAVVARAR